VTAFGEKVKKLENLGISLKAIDTQYTGRKVVKKMEKIKTDFINWKRTSPTPSTSSSRM
jgi:hypothetical protein